VQHDQHGQRERHDDVDAEPEPGREPGDRAVRVEVEPVPVQHRRQQRQRREHRDRDHGDPGLDPRLCPQAEQDEHEARRVPGAEERRGQRRLDGPGEV